MVDLYPSMAPQRLLVGDCVDGFDMDGNCTIVRERFLEMAELPIELDRPDVVLLEADEVIMAYDPITDVHHFFVSA